MDCDRLSDAFVELVKLVDRLRSPGGCPWDAKQTETTLKTYILEEAFEVAEAIEKADARETCAELGDLLFQIVFMARIAAESGQYDIIDVVEKITDKMIRRHPHVFGRVQVQSAEEVALNWAAIKKQERRETRAAASPLAAVPAGLPALMRAHRLDERASKAGFEREHAVRLLDQIRAALDALKEDLQAEQANGLERRLGNLLLECSALVRDCGLNAEHLLRVANQRFIDDFEALAAEFEQSGRDLAQVPSREKEKAWDAIRREKG